MSTFPEISIGRPARSLMGGWIGAVDSFLFQPASPVPLAMLRIGIAFLLLLQGLYLAPQFFDLYGRAGILQPGLLPEAALPALTFSGLQQVAARFGIGENAAALTLGGVYLVSLLALLVGWKTRFATVCVWLLHLIFTQGQTTSYGVDYFSHAALFLLIWMPAGAALALDQFPHASVASSWARISLRAFQIYLCIAYLASAVEKGLGAQWWNGEAIWRSLMLPSLGQLDASRLAFYPAVAKVAGWSTLLVEGGYFVFMWPSRTRPVWLLAIVALHVGIAVCLGLWLFSALMILLSVCSFGINAEPHLAAVSEVSSRSELGVSHTWFEGGKGATM